ncbi:MAG: hypothetical protein LBC61_04050 [Candidatus Peribacteria bacterium]|jgi:Fe-S cluster assembly protein SufB|nr:hypothetical protein [Candidatus Peribacteria bacterium]
MTQNTLNNPQDNIVYENQIIKGINEEVVKQISSFNKEPAWMLELRLKALQIFKEKDLPAW